jgi:hypothetical protein
MIRRDHGSVRRPPFPSLVMLLLLGLLAQACTACSMTTMPNGGSSSVTQRTATLNLGASQAGQATSLCKGGEKLLSGGFASSYRNYFAAAYANNTIFPTDVKQLEVHSYPSDGNGTPPSSQGQAMPGWTVSAVNTSPSAKTISVYANCIKDNSVATAVWSVSQYAECPAEPFFSRARQASYDGANAPASPRSGCGVGYEVGCPANSGFPVLTGGGWKLNKGDITFGSYPNQDQGIANKVWRVFAAPSVAQPGTAYAVCASGLFAEPLASAMASPLPSNSPQCVGDWCGYQSDFSQGVACPQGQLLVGGGHFARRTAVDTSAILPNQTGKWTVGHAITYADIIAKSNYLTTVAIYSVCVAT